MASDYTSFSDDVLASMLQDAEKKFFMLQNIEPEAGQENNHRIELAFAKQNVAKLTEALKAKSKEASGPNEESSFSARNNAEDEKVVESDCHDSLSDRQKEVFRQFFVNEQPN